MHRDRQHLRGHGRQQPRLAAWEQAALDMAVWAQLAALAFCSYNRRCPNAAQGATHPEAPASSRPGLGPPRQRAGGLQGLHLPSKTAIRAGRDTDGQGIIISWEVSPVSTTTATACTAGVPPLVQQPSEQVPTSMYPCLNPRVPEVPGKLCFSPGTKWQLELQSPRFMIAARPACCPARTPHACN